MHKGAVGDCWKKASAVVPDKLIVTFPEKMLSKLGSCEYKFFGSELSLKQIVIRTEKFPST